MSPARAVRVLVPSFGLSPDRALVLALHRLEQAGALPSWPLFHDVDPIEGERFDVPTYGRRASLRGAFRKDR